MESLSSSMNVPIRLWASAVRAITGPGRGPGSFFGRVGWILTSFLTALLYHDLAMCGIVDGCNAPES
jgi:hypothetical protein